MQMGTPIPRYLPAEPPPQTTLPASSPTCARKMIPRAQARSEKKPFSGWEGVG